MSGLAKLVTGVARSLFLIGMLLAAANPAQAVGRGYAEGFWNGAPTPMGRNLPRINAAIFRRHLVDQHHFRKIFLKTSEEFLRARRYWCQ
jgi:hypothetical protein